MSTEGAVHLGFGLQKKTGWNVFVSVSGLCKLSTRTPCLPSGMQLPAGQIRSPLPPPKKVILRFHRIIFSFHSLLPMHIQFLGCGTREKRGGEHQRHR